MIFYIASIVSKIVLTEKAGRVESWFYIDTGFALLSAFCF